MIEHKRLTRTAIFPAHIERIWETWVESGVFAGATYEVLDSEIRPTDFLLANDEHVSIDGKVVYQ